MLKGLILVGGKSSRMGRPKHLLEKEGKPIYQSIYDLLNSCGVESYISCNQKQTDVLESGYPVIVDRYDAIGPMGGIASAFEKEPETTWLAVACDLLSLTEEAIADLLTADDETQDVITYQKKANTYLETTLSIYKPSAFKHIENAVKSREYSLQTLLRKCTVKTLEVSNTDFLRNVNTKSDYLNS